MNGKPNQPHLEKDMTNLETKEPQHRANDVEAHSVRLEAEQYNHNVSNFLCNNNVFLTAEENDEFYADIAAAYPAAYPLQWQLQGIGGTV